MTSLQARQTPTPGIARRTLTDHLSCHERWWPRRCHRDPEPDHPSRTLDAGEHTQSPDRPPHPGHSGRESGLAGRPHSLQHRPTRLHIADNRRNFAPPGPIDPRPLCTLHLKGIQTLFIRTLCEDAKIIANVPAITVVACGSGVLVRHSGQLPRRHIRQEKHNRPPPQS